MMLNSVLYDELGEWEDHNFLNKTLFCLLLCVLLPVLALCYFAAPNSRISKLLKTPVFKFLSHTASSFWFLVLLVFSSIQDKFSDVLDFAPLGKKCCIFSVVEFSYYFGGARSKGFATLRNVLKLQFFDKIGHAKTVDFRFYSAIWRSESRIGSRYLEITSISLIYSLTFSRKKELLFWFPRGLNRLTCVIRQIRGDSKVEGLADCATATQGSSAYEK